ncbi:hypothetical protein ACHHYP_03889 [Achlya hypogyna]|uniref:Uncharacterized protein n=1 Tax=Achlya hypogyna TaxID=1202772 RepID=A0A1V9ZPR7_ACHHY|nr:hypothetical protein ACHHYP_03889 [Achlya hypogyna]
MLLVGATVAQDTPTVAPTTAPTTAPAPTTVAPTTAPTSKPTLAPTVAPTEAPTTAPTLAPKPVTAKPTVTLAPAPSDAPALTTVAPSITTAPRTVGPITARPISTVSSASSSEGETPTAVPASELSLDSSGHGASSSANATEPLTKKKAGSSSSASTSSEGFFSSGNWQMWAAVIGGLAVVGGIVAVVVMKANGGGDDYPDLDSPPPAAPTGKPVSPVRPYTAAPTKFEPMGNNGSYATKPMAPTQQTSFYAEAPPTDIARKAAVNPNVTFTYNEPRVSTLPILERRNSMNLTRFSDGSDVMEIGGKSGRSSSGASSAGWVDEPPRMDERESENFLATSGDSRPSYASTTFDIDRADSEASIVRYSSQYSEYSIDDRGTEAGGDRDSYEL